jgi:nitrogen-specific signal transduction histidine kinase
MRAKMFSLKQPAISPDKKSNIIQLWEDIMAAQHPIDSALLNIVLENSPDCVFILDLEGNIQWINQCGTELFAAASHKRLLNKSHRVLWSEIDLAEAVDHFNQALRGTESRFYCELRHLNGTPNYCDVIFKPAYNGSPDKVLYIIGAARPVNSEKSKVPIKYKLKSLKKINDELHMKNQRLHEVQQLKGDFLNTVSHELRTPLTSLKWASDSIVSRLDGKEDEELGKLLNIVHDESDRLCQLINGLLEFSRIEAGKLKLRQKPVPIEVIVDHCLTKTDSLIKKKRFRLETEVPECLPRVFVDRFKIESVVEHLIENSLKYSEEGGAIRIEAREQIDPRMLRLTVRDNGIGIPQDSLGKIFDEFYRVDSPVVKAARGPGLGLSIAKSFVEKHNGQIWCESSLGEGSAFHMTLPLAEDS